MQAVRGTCRGIDYSRWDHLECSSEEKDEYDLDYEGTAGEEDEWNPEDDMFEGEEEHADDYGEAAGDENEWSLEHDMFEDEEEYDDHDDGEVTGDKEEDAAWRK